MVCYPNLKHGNNDEQCCVIVFPYRWKDPFRAGRVSYGHTIQSVAARSIVHKFLKRSPSWTKPERVLMGLLWALRLAPISERFVSKKKEKSSLKTVNHHTKGIYASFKLQLPAFTEVVQWIHALAFGSNWLWGSVFESPWRIYFFLFLTS